MSQAKLSVPAVNPVKPPQFGRNDNVIASMDNFGGVVEHFDSVDVSLNARLPGRITFQGGTSTGRVRDDVCNLASNPTLSTLSANLFAGNATLASGIAAPVLKEQSDLMVGETVVAIGNAYGYDHTVSVGVVSAINRDVTLNKDIAYKSLIQTDAAINQIGRAHV